MFVCCDYCVSSGRGLCDELITHPEEFCRLPNKCILLMVNEHLNAIYKKKSLDFKETCCVVQVSLLLLQMKRCTPTTIQ
jgi:hypothetical protein